MIICSFHIHETKGRLYTVIQKAILSFLLIIIFSCNPAYAENVASILLWEMTWDTSLNDYVTLLEQNTPESEYTILEQVSGSGEAIYTIDKTAQDQSLSFSYRAVFSGGPTAGKIMVHALADVKNKPLRFEWMAIDIAPAAPAQEDIANGTAMRSFEDLYRKYSLDYGIGNAQYSYIAMTSGSRETQYGEVPMENGAVDFNAIEDQLRPIVETLTSYWLVIGNGHASCRLYISSAAGVDGGKNSLWRASYYFTKELQDRYPQ